MTSTFQNRIASAVILLLGATSVLAEDNNDAVKSDASPQPFYSGSWRSVDVDKQWIINGLTERRLIKITCEGVSNDQEFPSFLLVTEAGEYRWPINESGAAFVEARQLALREAGAGQVVQCDWVAIRDSGAPLDTVHVDVRPGDNILLGGLAKEREFSIAFYSTAGCSDLSAQLYIDNAPLVTVDNQPQLLTPNASYFGAGQVVEAKINGLCAQNAIPILAFSLAGR